MSTTYKQQIAGIVLAAGRSSRMGQPKQLLDWHGMPLVRVAVVQALDAHLDDIVVVTGGAHQDVERALAGLPVRLVQNARFAEGQSTSLHAGIMALRPDTAAAIVMLGDQPFVSAAIIDALADAWRAGAARIIAPSYRGRRGNPVLFDRTLFAELLAIGGDQGARELLTRRKDAVQLVPFDDDRPLLDIDTPEDLALALRIHERRPYHETTDE
jgi:molybdenum cofactor cytidylyltransferase